MRKLQLVTAAMASALVFSTSATAGFFDLTFKPYIGVNLGQSTTDSCITGKCDDTDTAGKIYGGFEFNEYMAMEVGYVDLGTVDYSAPAGTRETHGMTIQMLGTLSLNPSFTLLARGGLNILNTEVNGAVAGTPNGNTGDTDVSWSAGLGAQYNITQAAGLRLEWERFFETGSSINNGGTGEADIDLVSVGFVYKF